MKKPSEAINIVNLDPAGNSSGDNRRNGISRRSQQKNWNKN